MMPVARKTEEEWKKSLAPEPFHILREKGTEQAFTGKHLDNKKKGMYTCAGCGSALFSSDSKFNSGTGWPSFYQPAAGDSVTTKPDASQLMKRTEVLCSKCGGHLGHVFDDGPAPTGKRYCINSLALGFKEKKETVKKKP
ncbi:peptide-methionine (R)-S-oxide reductase MsrB [Candidatus Woesearchaeota archaeon]|nr:peptide-methionine (R)-S-oxide reductase MsrB [Candidatus Woesearchaeota archaeon]